MLQMNNLVNFQITGGFEARGTPSDMVFFAIVSQVVCAAVRYYRTLNVYPA
jgi:hypothetical protein